jgi:hypothetical protein
LLNLCANVGYRCGSIRSGIVVWLVVERGSVHGIERE